jgi:2,4-dienoyl-CoA reductase (NADPH2)
VKESLHCVGNASTGREHDFAMGPSASPRHVLVIGGGPAGLETARVLAGRGHRLTLWDAATELGGMLRQAGLADPLLERYAGWLARQVEQAGVDIQLGRRATVDDVHALGADEVVVATGAVWGLPPVPGAEAPHVFTIPRLEGWLRHDDGSVGDRVVILGGGKPSLSVGNVCAARGRSVTLVEQTGVFGAELGLPGRWRLVSDIERAGVRLLGDATVEAIEPGRVRVTTSAGDEQLDADTVVVAGGAVPDTRLADELALAGVTAHVVGDCGGVRRIEGANLDAAHLALALG